MRRERGFVLLIVLMAVGLLSLLTAQLTASARSDAVVAAALRDAARAAAAAEGGIAQAEFVLLAGGPAAQALAAGEPLAATIGGVRVRVSARAPRVTVNPNADPPLVLVANLRDAGIEPALAARLADSLRGWHAPGAIRGYDEDAYRRAGLRYGPPRALFGSPDEVGLVLGMSPAAFAQLRPHLDVYGAPGGDQRPGGVGVPDQPAARVVEVTAVAGGAARTATLRVHGKPDEGGALIEVLDWADQREP